MSLPFPNLAVVMPEEVLKARRLHNGPLHCWSCDTKVVVCQVCEKGFYEGAPTQGCKDGVHLHPHCYRTTNTDERLKLGGLIASARARLAMIKSTQSRF